MASLAPRHRPNKPSKRPHIEHSHHADSDSGSTSSHASESDAHIRRTMLDALARQSLADFSLDEPSSSHHYPSKREQIQEEDEWSGISECETTDEEEDEFDDGEDLLETSRKLLYQNENSTSFDDADVIVFHDPSSSVRPENDSSERKAFMASSLKKQNPSIDKTLTSKSKSVSKDEAEEAHLQSLDRSLAKLITTLAEPKSNLTGLEAILSAELPPPTKSSNPQRHPRRIKQGMAKASLKRSQAADREAEMGSIVRAHGSKTVSKRQKRCQDGTEDRERRERRERTDRGAGGMVKVSKREIGLVEKSGKGSGSSKKSTGSRMRR